MKKEMSRALCSSSFFLSFAIMFLCLAGFSFPRWVSDWSEPIIEWREERFTPLYWRCLFGGRHADVTILYNRFSFD